MTIHLILITVAIVLAFLAAFNVPSRISLFPLAFAVYLINLLVP